jgi:NAD dependent epimerase/dehydratase family enzyme
VPASILRLFFGEGASILLEGQRVIPHRLTDFGFQFRFTSIHEALFNLG